MTGLIHELFRLDPLIYEIDGDYYAFGSGICKNCNPHYAKINLENFEKAINTEKKVIISQLYGKLNFLAEFIIHSKGRDRDPIKEFYNMDFSDNQIKQIRKQFDRYIDVYSDYIEK